MNCMAGPYKADMPSANLHVGTALVQYRLGALDYPQMNVYFGTRVKAAREALGITQPELADAIRAQGISVAEGEISRIERGAVKNPSLPKVVAIAVALGVTTDELLAPDGRLPAGTPAEADDEVTARRRRRVLQGLAAAWEREASEDPSPQRGSDRTEGPNGR